jgi:hypothetical protein
VHVTAESVGVQRQSRSQLTIHGRLADHRFTADSRSTEGEGRGSWPQKGRGRSPSRGGEGELAADGVRGSSPPRGREAEPHQEAGEGGRRRR